MIGSGYTCASCHQWIPDGMAHACSPTAAPNAWPQLPTWPMNVWDYKPTRRDYFIAAALAGLCGRQGNATEMAEMAVLVADAVIKYSGTTP